VDALIAPAQQIFADENARRGGAIQLIRDRWKPAKRTSVRRLCVIAPSHFRLWDDAGFSLMECFGNDQVTAVRFDPDNPASASPVAFASAASECEAVVAPNTARA